MMKRSIISVACMLCAPVVFASDATVVSVYPIYASKLVTETVYEVHEVCRNTSREPRGGIESMSNSIFGGVGGVLGTAAGVAIGSEIGSGTGRTAMKVVGGIVGNKIGNDISEANSQSCSYKEIPVQRTYSQEVIEGYHIKVLVNDQYYTVRRNFAPSVGDTISVETTIR